MTTDAATAVVLTQLLRLSCDDERRTNFVCNAISVYFRRLQRASPEKLRRFGFSPVATAVLAELALARVANMDFSPAFLVRLIADRDTAALALRAVRFYAARYAELDFEAVSAEVGERASDVMAAAGAIHFMLKVVDELA
ncbi:hypothetical protein CBF45_07880 [Bordetella sp. J329]|jgi:hypothetical protein|uniref:hypothetical protein n=1 Tax=Kerstersia gyiorum TaxID=206506 RepID=UPI000FDC6C4F|nr:hypothetical protein [Kerstersia gyiorum]AZV93648.1 hypothetical protein CBF45_07880 [Bordetella sp. J329]MCH4271206.1 hypothetical protein [Kerstersia gyiorum]MCI1227722.1 hypothetical protein [Kerstersia gyiorum]